MTFSSHLARIAAGAALSLAFVLPSAAAGAQSFPTADPVLRRIWALGMDSSETYRFAQVLTDSIGPRLTGTPGQRRGNDWLVATYRQLGIEARNEKYGTWLGWRRGVTHVDLVAPRVRSLEAMMLAWGPGTGGKDVQAGTLILPAVADTTAFRAWLPKARGTFVLVSAPQPTCRPDSNWQQYALPESVEKMRAERRAAAEAWTARVARTGHTTRTRSTGTFSAPASALRWRSAPCVPAIIRYIPESASDAPMAARGSSCAPCTN